MLKKIGLLGVFAVAFIAAAPAVTFHAAPSASMRGVVVEGPVMRGLSPCGWLSNATGCR